MKVTFYRKDEIKIDLEWMAQKLIDSIKFNLKHRLDDTIEELVASDLEDYFNECDGLLDDLELYDNYYDLLEVITNNIIVWCAENNELFYDTITEYRNFLEACDEQSTLPGVSRPSVGIRRIDPRIRVYQKLKPHL